MISCSIYDDCYDQALSDLGTSVNIMPKVIFEQLQYPGLAPILMYVQLVDSTIRNPEGIVENLLVRVKNSFILANFVVLDMKGDLGVQLILGRASLRDIKVTIEVEIGEIRFPIGVDNMRFKFQLRDEQSCNTLR
jgi:hypothetical protein